jgi:tRNA A-37 threonylcarbamoyl transferase component Bud32
VPAPGPVGGSRYIGLAMASADERFETSVVAGLRILHRPAVPASVVAQAIALHRENYARGREACEHWGPGSSVSHVLIRSSAGPLDLAVKWNPWRGWRGGLSDALHGSRARRALAASRRVAAVPLLQPEIVALAERRAAGVVRESFLLTRFESGADPLPVALARLRNAPSERRALARRLGETIGTLHAAGLDHPDLKHSNLLVDPAGQILLLDLDALGSLGPLAWRRRVRALAQLEAFSRDLYDWLPDSDRTRFLAGYLRMQPDLAAQRRRLWRDVRYAAARRLARLSSRDRSVPRHFPLAPRDANPCTVADAVEPGWQPRGSMR